MSKKNTKKVKKEVELDLTDRKLLYALDLDARQSYSEIGKKLRISKQVVQYRINRLIERGVITYFYTMLDTAKLGYLGFRVYMKLQDASPEREQEIVDYLVNNEYSWWVVSVDGKWDVNLLIWFKDVHEFEDFWRQFLLRYRKNIQNRLLSIFTTLYHYKRAYFLDNVPDESKVELVSRGPEVKLDKGDLSILKTIAMNARMPVLEISERVGISPRIVSHRIKKMMALGVIQGFRPMIDLNRIGYVYYKVDINLNDISIYDELLKLARLDPNITYVDRTVGAGDFEIDVEVKDLAGLHRVIDGIRNRFGDRVRDYEYFQINNIYKILYLPGSLPPVKSKA